MSLSWPNSSSRATPEGSLVARQPKNDGAVPRSKVLQNGMAVSDEAELTTTTCNRPPPAAIFSKTLDISQLHTRHPHCTKALVRSSYISSGMDESQLPGSGEEHNHRKVRPYGEGQIVNCSLS